MMQCTIKSAVIMYRKTYQQMNGANDKECTPNSTLLCADKTETLKHIPYSKQKKTGPR